MTDSHRPSHPVEVDGARSQGADITLNTLNLRWEHREILYFQGAQYINEDLVQEEEQSSPPSPSRSIPGAFAESEFARRTERPWSSMRRLPLIPNATRDVWEYRCDEQRVHYTLRMSSDREAFRNALETPGALVFYAGHARWGQGPTFGPALVHKHEFWGGESDDLSSGAVRMGFPFIGRASKDIFEHGYTPQLVSASVVIDPALCDPENLRPLLARFRPLTLREIDPELPALLPSVSASERFWARVKQPHFSSLEERRKNTTVILHAGWEHTPSEAQRMDLGSIQPRCRAFICIGCATYWHFHTPWRGFKRWRELSDDQLFYATTKTIWIETANYFLYHMLTYPHLSGWRPWKPWLDWSMDRTNRWLAAYDHKHRNVRVTNGRSGRFTLPSGECHCGTRG